MYVDERVGDKPNETHTHTQGHTHIFQVLTNMKEDEGWQMPARHEAYQHVD